MSNNGSNTLSTQHHFKRRGLLFILSSPSGAGKSTLTQHLLSKEPLLKPSISTTTRQKRASEIEGTHYHFVNHDDFDMMRERGQFLEWAEVHGNCYGTPRKPVEEALNQGYDVIFDIDWQGTKQIVEKIPNDVVSVFVLPPSMIELKSRLERRAEDSHENIAKRLKNASIEISQWENYDYVLVNLDLNRVFFELCCILTAERLKRVRQNNISKTIDALLEENNSLEKKIPSYDKTS